MGALSQTHLWDLSRAIKEKDNDNTKKNRTLNLQRTANKYAAKCRFCRKLMLIFSSFVTKQPSSNLRLWGAKRAFSSYQCGLGSNPPVDAICGLSLLLRFSRGTPRTPTPPPPTNIFKSNLIQKGSRCTSTPSHSEKTIGMRKGVAMQGSRMVDKEPCCVCSTTKSLYFY